MTYLFIFILGALLGSFYNAYALRRLNDISIVKPRSFCYNCNYKLKVYENIPIFSYIFLRGKCSNCKNKIKLNYFLAEVITPVTFLLNYYMFGFTYQFLVASILSSIMIIIFITDYKEMIILDETIYISGILISLIILYFNGIDNLYLSLGHGVMITIFMYVIKVIGNYVFKKESLGDGDIKLSFLAGLVLGPFLGFLYPFIASYVSLPFAAYTSLKKKINYIPFGPFLILSIYILYVYSDFFTGLFNNLLGLS